ncbi:ABC transporter substrate-binding protein [Roseomonas sp. NAR14]|uniref:ABC transporter substrate-binding protein n=1 Tax=Roseomonas acroporae TaxID=2937791 RepID=A0A9X1Y2N4_9PROT|nr:ABC transporter substrate-binding protein [Roseomonas acroporae]MCK8783034.1 ABC transporter substrate-binding protein [Roseomonas acroporae]
MFRRQLLTGAAAATLATPLAELAAPRLALAQALPKITIGMSGWTGFAPLTLAEQAGLFRDNGIEVETRFVPQRERNLALASGALNCVVTTVDTMILWASAAPLVQVLVLDRSKGGDGIAARPRIGSLADLKGKQVAVDGAGTSPYFTLAYMLRKSGSGITMRDLTLATLAPQPAAQAFVAGQFDACATYEPYLSQVRAMGADKGKILATTLDYPCVVDTLAFKPDFIRDHPEAVKRVVKSWFDAIALIGKEPDRAFEIMGRRVNQTGDQFKASAQFIEWLDAGMNRDYVTNGLPAFMQEAAEVQKETGVIRAIPDLGPLLDKRFVT